MFLGFFTSGLAPSLIIFDSKYRRSNFLNILPPSAREASEAKGTQKVMRTINCRLSIPVFSDESAWFKKENQFMENLSEFKFYKIIST